MNVPQFTEEEARRNIAAVEQALREGHPAKGLPGSHQKTATRIAADRLGMNAKTLLDRVRPGGTIERTYGLKTDWTAYVPPAPPPPPEPEDTRSAVQPVRRDVHDAAFWRGRTRALEKELHRVESALAQISGLAGEPIEPPQWLAASEDAPKRRSVLGCLVSDVHMGEVIDPDEIGGVNAFNPEIAVERLRRYFEAAAVIGPRWGSDTDIQGAFVAFAGDLVSGDIHEELARTNALTSNEQVRAMVEAAVAGISLLRGTYGKVHAVFVPGNHGRQTHRPTAKLYARLNYDTLIGQFVADAFKGDPAVTFQIAQGRDVVTPIFGRTIFTTHGDGMGTGGGMGFAGPLLPIVRGTKKVEAQQARFNRRPDLILHGHYHHSANPGPVFSNGSVPGYSEYGNGLRMAAEGPKQWLFLLHEKWWVRERCEVQLADPGPPAPIRVPAVMERTP